MDGGLRAGEAARVARLEARLRDLERQVAQLPANWVRRPTPAGGGRLTALQQGSSLATTPTFTFATPLAVGGLVRVEAWWAFAWSIRVDGAVQEANCWGRLVASARFVAAGELLLDGLAWVCLPGSSLDANPGAQVVAAGTTDTAGGTGTLVLAGSADVGGVLGKPWSVDLLATVASGALESMKVDPEMDGAFINAGAWRYEVWRGALG